jgi:hypothetical protein
MPETSVPVSSASAAVASDNTASRRQRSRGLVDQSLVDELNLAEEVAGTAAKPTYASPLTEEGIDAAFLENLGTKITEADKSLAAAAGKSADRKAVTQEEKRRKAAVLGLLRIVWSRAKRKYKAGDPMREKYFIAQRLSNRPLIERATAAVLENLATDTLPAHKPTHTAALAAALKAYKDIQVEQTGEQSGATTGRAGLADQVKAIADLRREIQHAADAVWPAENKANAGIRKAFRLSASKTKR